MLSKFRCWDKNIPRRNTEASSEPGLSFHKRARRGRRESCSTDEQFLARFMTCRWQKLFKLRQRNMRCQIPKGLSSYSPHIASMLIHDFTCWCVLYSLHTKSFPSPPEKLLLPAPQVPFKHLSVNVSHHSPSSALLGTRNRVLPDLVSRYYNYWLCLQLLFESDCILRAVFISHCNPDQCLAHFLSKCS